MAMPATLMTAAKRCKQGDRRQQAARAVVSAAEALKEIHRRQHGAAAIGHADRGPASYPGQG